MILFYSGYEVHYRAIDKAIRRPAVMMTYFVFHKAGKPNKAFARHAKRRRRREDQS